MIKVNGNEVKVGHFPDHTQCIKFDHNWLRIDENTTQNDISWFYESDEELFTLMCVTNWIRKSIPSGRIILCLPYVPNARMDRIKSIDENFSLKVFADFINSLGFDRVYTTNVHSNVAEALINNIVSVLPNYDVMMVNAYYRPDVIFFPDEGACKRYSDMPIVKDSDIPVTFGIKKRDWKTGDIKGLDVISDIDLKGKKVLIVDDICSAGGTFKFSAIKLKELGAKDVALYVSHCEDNIQNGDLLKTDYISKIYTTNSILTISDPKIQIINEIR